MTHARTHCDQPLPAAEALARGYSLLEAVGAERPVLLYAAPLQGAAVVLGAYQHAGHALRPEAFDALALPVLRRRSGGAAGWAAQGVLYLALGLREASTLMACPPGRILNRNVRGMLAGLRARGVAAHYFGRDFVAFGTEPGIYLGWDEHGSGRVLLEAFVALETAFTPAAELGGYPPPSDPPLRGKRPTTLRAAGLALPAAEVVAALFEGHAKAFGLTLQPEPPSAAELARAASLRSGLSVDLGEQDGLCWAPPRQEAIGFVSAGVRLDAEGRLQALRLGGDFYQHHDCPAQLQARLLGRLPDAGTLGSALDAVYAARPGLIEGVRTLDTLRAALLDAVAAARAEA